MTTCIEDECELPARARHLCNIHYQRRKAKGQALPDPQRWLHRLSEVSAEARTAVCSSCGPTRIRLSPAGTPVCASRRRLDAERYKERAASKLSRPMSEGRRREGLTIAGIRGAVLARQESCEICGSSEGLSVDHDHSCCIPSSLCLDCVRGVLCHACNTALGSIGDSIERLESAIRYLREHEHTP